MESDPLLHPFIHFECFYPVKILLIKKLNETLTLILSPNEKQ